MTMLNLNLTFAVISSEARNLLNSSIYAIPLLYAICWKHLIAAICGIRRFLATLEMTTLWLFCN